MREKAAILIQQQPLRAFKQQMPSAGRRLNLRDRRRLEKTTGIFNEMLQNAIRQK